MESNTKSNSATPDPALGRSRLRVTPAPGRPRHHHRGGGGRPCAGGEPVPKSEGRYDDQIAFVHRADELAQSLLEEGYTAMKIWPFDPYAEDNGGGFIPEAAPAI